MRLNKAIASLGICSRREADDLIKNNKIFINGKIINKLATEVNYNDIIKINNIEYSIKENKIPKIWLFNKPRGLVTTHKDEQGRPTVFDYLAKKINQRVISVGRLDMDSEGLLILTDSGDFARQAEMSNWERHYKVRFLGNLTADIINNLKKGVIIDNQKYAPIIIKKSAENNKWCTCILTEGKNREIRKLFKFYGLLVNRLIRTQYGAYKLGDLKSGEVTSVTPQLP